MQYELEALINGFNQVANFRKNISANTFRAEGSSSRNREVPETDSPMNLYRILKKEKIFN